HSRQNRSVGVRTPSKSVLVTPRTFASAWPYILGSLSPALPRRSRNASASSSHARIALIECRFIAASEFVLSEVHSPCISGGTLIERSLESRRPGSTHAAQAAAPVGDRRQVAAA